MAAKHSRSSSIFQMKALLPLHFKSFTFVEDGSRFPEELQFYYLEDERIRPG